MSSLPDQPLLTPLPPRRGPVRRTLHFLRLALESLALVFVIAVATTPWLSSLAWPIDLIANFTAQALFLTAALIAWLVLFRRWKLLAVAAIAGLSQVIILAAPRAAWAGPGDPAITRASAVRILQFNINPHNTRAGDAARFIEECDADLICLVEPPYDISVQVYQRRRFDPTNPHLTRLSPKEYASFQYILSRWPTREYPNGHDEAGEPPFLAIVVDHPLGPFGLILLHPPSPRNRLRWETGNQLIRDAAAVINRMRAEGLEVMFSTDLNGSPSSYRSGLLARLTDLRRCKPLWRAEGTFPSGRAWPASILLDDVWISPGLKVASWDTLSGAGSDHRAVLADIALPAAK
ncbi:MAG: hypothetical protein IT436_01155 [Phycisphaerales bacterium]|nr:hypothetical protein [Phycisphaerales bacterium]